jgi:hypothetical protein
MKRTTWVLLVTLCLIIVSTTTFAAGTKIKKSFGQTLYVPAMYNDFSYIPTPGSPEIPQFVVSTVIIRNMDPYVPIRVNRLTFYDQNGEEVAEFLDQFIVIEKWNSITYNTDFDTTGVPPYPGEGGRPFFILEWEAESPVIPLFVAIGVAIISPNDPSGRFIGLNAVSATVIEEK